jgi:hypothetical protein
VLGRPLTPKEAREMWLINRIDHAYHQRKANQNWAEWATKNKGDNDLLVWAEKVAYGDSD